ncbi:MAG: hypothetical protein JSR55_02860 [Proteobacteria bacterium]|nr:hypothetical protein [Pseudomonadota bacterium]
MDLNIYMAAGFAGAVLVILAYLANQMGRLPSDDWRFPGANLAGSILILASLYSAWNFPSAVIELFWAAISLYGLVRHRIHRVSSKL